ncbi:transposase [Tessaracoccus rhinocerotis]|uniref:Transposase n=1 Tax=Tessaracoccus rhinocerotis TaxID=1689449 RepID=A0A553JVT7_9ACTN|nr:transposase [Tessaracoccus rhinocerotis]TRY16556.1 transposase [Tessaracoccus rhinocerotis]
MFKTWLEAPSPEFRVAVEIVAMDGFTGYQSATAEAVPDTTTVTDLFHLDSIGR